MHRLSRWYASPKRALFILIALGLGIVVGLFQAPLGSPTHDDTPQFTVIIRHFGVDPETMERTITIPLENEISRLYGIREMRSNSEFNTSRVVVTLHPDVSSIEFYFGLRDSVDRVYAQLPSSVQRPNIFSSTTRRNPFFILAMRSSTLDLMQLRDFAEHDLKRRLEAIPGVGEVEIGGGMLSEIHVVLDTARAAGYGITPSDVAQLLRTQHVQVAAGRLEETNRYRTAIIRGRLEHVHDIGRLEIPAAGGSRIRLQEIATVSVREKERETISRVDGTEQIVAHVKLSGNESPIATSRAIVNLIPEYADAPVEFNTLYDMGQDLWESIRQVLWGIVAAIVVVGIFLSFSGGQPIRAVITILSIPVIAGATIASLTALRIPVEVVTLSGIAVGIGMIADVTIILFSERHPERVVLPLAASTTTTIIAILPVFFIPDQSALSNIALAFILLIGASFVLSIVFLPPFLATVGRAHGARPRRHRLKWHRALYAITTHVDRHTRMTLILSALICVVLVGGLILIPKEVTPARHDNLIFLHIEFDSGANVYWVDEHVAWITRELSRFPGIERVESLARRENASVSVRHSPAFPVQQFRRFVESINDGLYDGFIFFPAESTGDLSFEVAVVGPDVPHLREISRALAGTFAQTDWVSGSVLHFKEGGPEWIFAAQYHRLTLAGIPAASIADQLRWGLHGPVSLKWIENDKEMDLRVMGDSATFDSMEMLQRMPIIAPQTRTAIPIAELGSFTLTAGIGRIRRLNRQRAEFLSVQTPSRAVGEVIERAEHHLRSTEIPLGYSFRLDPRLRANQQQFSHLQGIVVLAVFLIYLVLAAQFESLTIPIVPILSIPLSMAFPIAGYWIIGRALTTTSLFGLIIVTGMVVNNAIVLVSDITEQRVSLRHALRKRCVPLSLTTGTTVIGLIPLVFLADAIGPFVFDLVFSVFFGILGSYLITFTCIPALLTALPGLLSKTFVWSIPHENPRSDP